ncbi:hypothetical protein GCM10027093_14800 [Paraburkholderia jirisanensis]
MRGGASDLGMHGEVCRVKQGKRGHRGIGSACLASATASTVTPGVDTPGVDTPGVDTPGAKRLVSSPIRHAAVVCGVSITQQSSCRAPAHNRQRAPVRGK